MNNDIPKSNSEENQGQDLADAWKETNKFIKEYRKAHFKKGKRYYLKNSNYAKLSESKTHCELCSNDEVPKRLLDVDHIDGNWENDDANNLWILCRYCHMRKTQWQRNGDNQTFLDLQNVINKSEKHKNALRETSNKWIKEREKQGQMDYWDEMYFVPD